MACLALAAVCLAQEPAAEALRRGAAFHAEGKPREAIAALRQALKADPNLARAQDLLAASLAEAGYCKEALPGVKRAAARASDRDFRRQLQIDGLRCAMSLNATDDLLAFLGMLSRDFPADPEVLYLKTHAYSDLSIRASQELIAKSPDSYQVHLLGAESLELQGNWDGALGEYRKVLAKDATVRGIHYRIARLLLSKPNSGAAEQKEARAELEAELKSNPSNAGAEYVLGELDRRDEKWESAIQHFTTATKLDAGFGDAYLGLGRALMEVGRYAEAIAPLEAAAKLQPDNPEVHFRIGTAYRNSGRMEEANRAFEKHKETTALAKQRKDAIKKSIDGIQR